MQNQTQSIWILKRGKRIPDKLKRRRQNIFFQPQATKRKQAWKKQSKINHEVAKHNGTNLTVNTFSWKLNDAQKKYMVTGQELLVAVKACKHFGKIIRCCDIRIHTDHQNLMHDDTPHANLWEQQARIFLNAEFASVFIHIKGMDNAAADGLSQLPMLDEDDEGQLTRDLFATINHLDWDVNTDFPFDMHQIMLAQEKDEDFKCHSNSKFATLIVTREINEVIITTINDRVWVPTDLQQRIVEWYHNNLQHVGVTRMINVIGQTFAWKGLA